MKETEVKCKGIGFVDAVTLLFIALKLCGVINWPWVWVLCPLWISIGIIGQIAFIIVLFTASQ